MHRNASTLAISKAAQRKAVHLIAATLAKDGIFVGEVTVLGTIKGTVFDSGSDGLAPEAVANKFLELYTARAPTAVNFP